MGLESGSWDGEGRAGSAGAEGLGHTEGMWYWAYLSQPPVPPTCPMGGSHTQTPQPHPPTCPVHVPSMCPTHVPPVCPLFDPAQPHPYVPSVSLGPTCVPGMFSSLVPPACTAHVSHSCPTCVSHSCVPQQSPPCVRSCFPPMCHPRVLFMTPCVFPIPTHVSHPYVTSWLPSVPPLYPHIPPMCPLRVSHLWFSFACPLQSLPVPSP